MNKKMYISICITLLFLLIMLPLSGFCADDAKDQAKIEKKQMHVQYRPPMRGAPVRRVGGGSRGVFDNVPFLMTLTPEQGGLTVNVQPVLYWYISKPWDGKIQFAINDSKTYEQLAQIELTPEGHGIQSFSLKEHNIKLKPGHEYEWFVALVPTPKKRSGDIVAGSMIACIKTPKGLTSKLAKQKDAPYYVYAQEGLWYDALQSLSEKIAKTSNNKALKEERAELMEQVNLPNVAAFDRKSGQ